MASGMKINMGNFRLNIGVLNKRTQDALDKSAEEVGQVAAGAAKDRAPVDEGNLTQDIAHNVQHDGNKTAAVIYVPENAPSSRYAIRMHEDTYNLGQLSQAKQAQLGVTVGRKYITRGIDDSVKDQQDLVKNNFKDILR